MLRRSLTLAVSCCLVLAWPAPVNLLFAQDDAKKVVQPPPRPRPKKHPRPRRDQDRRIRQERPPKTTRQEGCRQDRTPKAAELPPIPPEVQAKIDAARKAVAEAIVAAQDAGLIETSIDPPPDPRPPDQRPRHRRPHAQGTKKPYGMSPEVFGAWFTGFGKTEGINYETDLRIMHPAPGSNSITNIAPASWSNTSRKPVRPRDLLPHQRKKQPSQQKQPSRPNRPSARSQNHRAAKPAEPKKP